MSCRLKLRIVPNAKRSALAGIHGDAIKLKIAAPAIEGKANEALIEFLAETLGVVQRDVTLLSGAKSRDKFIEIISLDEASARARLTAES
jgi:uncharacterized protein (TIGR00251 family)